MTAPSFAAEHPQTIGEPITVEEPGIQALVSPTLAMHASREYHLEPVVQSSIPALLSYLMHAAAWLELSVMNFAKTILRFPTLRLRSDLPAMNELS